MYATEADAGTSVWKSNYMGIYKTNSLSSITASATGQPLIELARGGYWRKGKGTGTSWKMSIHGNKIEVKINPGSIYNNERTISAEDNEFTKGGYGFFTVSQPTNFWCFKINTTKALTLQEIIARTTWNPDDTNIIVNFNNQQEEELSDQACVNAFNSKGIHYEQVTKSTNASDVNTFLGKIGNRGKYVESSNYNTYMSQVTDYIVTYVRNHT